MNFREYKQLVHQPKLTKMKGDIWYRWERNISVVFSWLIYKYLPFIKPNFITFISFIVLFIVAFLSLIKSNNSSSVAIIQLILLYCITFLDKIDGELARAKNYITQKGIYYDWTVHLFYPFIFYLTVGSYFYKVMDNNFIFLLTLILGLFTIGLISFRTSALLVKEEVNIKQLNIHDYILNVNKKKKIWPFFIRVLDYLTFMIYAWTLFFYLLVVILSIYNIELSYILYLFHLVLSLLVVGIRIFWFYPRKKLLKKVD